MNPRHVLTLAVTAALLATPFSLRAEDAPKAKPKPYPLKTCIVSDEELGSMGTPLTEVYEGQEIKFCCDGCPGRFKKDPAKYLKKLEGK
jgi:YHS domain-containing protein